MALKSALRTGVLRPRRGGGSGRITAEETSTRLGPMGVRVSVGVVVVLHLTHPEDFLHPVFDTAEVVFFLSQGRMRRSHRHPPQRGYNVGLHGESQNGKQR